MLATSVIDGVAAKRAAARRRRARRGGRGRPPAAPPAPRGRRPGDRLPSVAAAHVDRARGEGDPRPGPRRRPGARRASRRAWTARAIEPPIRPRPRSASRTSVRPAGDAGRGVRSATRRSPASAGGPGSSGGFSRRIRSRRSTSRRSTFIWRAAARAAALVDEERLQRRGRVDLAAAVPAREAGHGLIVRRAREAAARACGQCAVHRPPVSRRRAARAGPRRPPRPGTRSPRASPARYLLVGREVEVAVPAQVEEDDPRDAPASRPRSASSIATRIAWFDSGAGRMPSVRANWTPAAKLAFWWTARASMRPWSLSRLTSGRHAVVAQPAGVDRLRDEVVAEGVHLDDRGHLRRVAEVVGVDAAGQRRRRLGLDGDDPVAGLAAELAARGTGR